jgi:hypothetical protein
MISARNQADQQTAPDMEFVTLTTLYGLRSDSCNRCY